MWKLFIYVLVIALTGCAVRGTMQGVAKGDDTSDTVVFVYQTVMGVQGALSVTMPDGEIFSGKFIKGVAQPTGTGLSANISTANGGVAAVAQVGVDTEMHYTGGGKNTFIATLFGDKGSIMKCHFTSVYANDLTSGGLGKCSTDNGYKVEIQFNSWWAQQ